VIVNGIFWSSLSVLFIPQTGSICVPAVILAYPDQRGYHYLSPASTMTAKSVEPDSDGHTIFAPSGSETDVEVNGASTSDDQDKQQALQKRLTLTFKNVTVRVAAPGEALGETLWSRADPGKLLGLLHSEEHPKRVRMQENSGLCIFLALRD
jgi:hypothetical protein